MDCRAKPTSSATSSVCRICPEVREENRVVGMIPRMNPVVPSPWDSWEPPPSEDWSKCALARSRPAPGCTMLPTTRPIASANVDITMKYSRARPPTLPTVAALATDPTPSTMVQKITGGMTILMSATNPVPSGFSATPTDGNSSPTTTPSTTATMTAM